MKVKHIAALAASLSLLSGCSIFNPYDSEFQCERGKDYGKCISISEAYKDSLKGGQELADEAGAPVLYRKDEEGKLIPVEVNKSQFKKAEYSKMRQLVEAPVSPVVVPPIVLRTLITGYKTAGAVYSPRYIHFFAAEPTFLLGEEVPESGYTGRRTIYPNGK